MIIGSNWLADRKARLERERLEDQQHQLNLIKEFGKILGAAQVESAKEFANVAREQTAFLNKWLDGFNQMSAAAKQDLPEFDTIMDDTEEFLKEFRAHNKGLGPEAVEAISENSEFLSPSDLFKGF